MSYFLKRFKPGEKYSIARFVSLVKDENTVGETFPAGEKWDEAKGKQKEANDAINAGNTTPLGEWQSAMSAQSFDLED